MKPPTNNNKEGAESHKLESESKPIWKSMSMFLVPLLLSNVLQSVGQLFGMVVVGRWLGVNDLAAISAFFPLFFLLVSFVIGIGSGSSILIGQAFGAKNEDRLKAIVGTTLTFTFIIGVVLAIVGSIFAMDIMRLMGTPENIIEISVHYARILFISMPILFLYFAYTTFMRGTGDSKTPFYFLIVSTALNMILLPILIFGWLGAPKLDVYGAAYASVISTVITFIVMLVYLKKKNHPLQLDSTVRKYLRMDWGLLKLLLRLGIPASINMILVSLSEIAVIAFVNRYGSDATAAYGVVNQVASYVQMPAVSLGITVSIFAAQSIGANQFDRLQKVVKAGIIMNYVIGGVLISLIYLFSRDILSLFLTSQTTIEIAHSLVMITLWSYLIFGHAQIISATMRASGTVLWPTVIGVVSIWLVEVPVAYYLSYHTSLGIEGIWIGYPAAFIVSLILQYAYYKLSWQKKRITRLVS
ncbi:MATE family efflux transporter [Bacillus paranthracis]|uniref:MATE family efflux transporter n=3 Tax=Bacillus cereus group TaxID=86661 RepID=A0A1J9YUF4_9BACI|nr:MULTISPECIES: MATE family efflux transporter [Bacillus]ACJ78122.1 putative MATE efflux protein [Bacillus cereus AH187]ACM12212.1 Na+ driven multidrug efflux pump [Bacillus cereus Q1]ASZ18440.1 MATE family efflux transporter [Bacillus cereus]EDZ58432.1 putative MATE efflux protein [Bacillus cereus H3081.97]EEK45479.1 MATE efflux [Bacillus cereus m1293]EEL01172.1 MATE efflux [Bacillus cereus BDRD-ST26]EJP87542.1 MATE efflux family protein [Bacillus cereus IS075]EJQ08876.1 MATE efflux famil